jgi:hypothetical protein
MKKAKAKREETMNPFPGRDSKGPVIKKILPSSKK